MSEILYQILHRQDLMVWGLVFIAFLDFLAIITISTVLYLTHETKQAVEAARRAERESDERARQMIERMNFYLFNKLGPIDTK